MSDAEYIADQSDIHPEDYCHRCGGPNISWFTPGAVWDPVMRADGEWKWGEIICPACFVNLAGGGTWHLIPARDDGEAWTSADERERIKADAATEALAGVGAEARAVDELEAVTGPLIYCEHQIRPGVFCGNPATTLTGESNETPVCDAHTPHTGSKMCTAARACPEHATTEEDQ